MIRSIWFGVGAFIVSISAAADSGAPRPAAPVLDVNPSVFDCRLSRNEHKGKEVCEVHAFACHYALVPVEGPSHLVESPRLCENRLVVECDNQLLFHGDAIHDSGSGFETLTGVSSRFTLRYPSTHSDDGNFVVSAWLNDNGEIFEGSCRVHHVTGDNPDELNR